MSKEGTKTGSSNDCPRCGKKFSCKPDDIAHCECSQVSLTKEEYRYISSAFSSCVCNGCLKELREEYNMKFHYNKPNNFIKRKFTLLIVFFLLAFESLQGQTYAPPAGQPGTGAMHKDSSAFVSWATACTVIRGYQDISDPSLGFASVGDQTMATGKAQSNGVVSLGDGGSAVCTFAYPVKNDAGNDFSVFENAFNNGFLELAFVEVSSDGIHFFRFPSHSQTDTVTQTAGGGLTDATKINNLAGKYRDGYGTPFDLQELSGTPGLNINTITHIKIIDVVGSITNSFATRDSYGNKVNDPWPTPFPSSGFDLDAIGVIHENTVTGFAGADAELMTRIFPNPVSAGTPVQIQSLYEIRLVEILDQRGVRVLSAATSELDISALPQGIYVVKVSTTGGSGVSKLIIF